MFPPSVSASRIRWLPTIPRKAGRRTAALSWWSPETLSARRSRRQNNRARQKLRAVRRNERRTAHLFSAKIDPASNLVVIDLHFDRSRLGDLFLRQHDRQDAIVVIGVDILSVHRIGNREVAHERPVAAFQSVKTLVLLVSFELPFALQRQSSIFELNVDVPQVHARNVGLKN